MSQELAWEFDNAATGKRWRAFVGDFVVSAYEDGRWSVDGVKCDAGGIETNLANAKRRAQTVWEAMRCDD